MSLDFSRYMDVSQFARALGSLRAYRSEYMGDRLLESLEAARLLIPGIRIRYPDPIARRLWLESHEQPARQLKHPIEPDGPRWESAVELLNAVHRWRNFTVYGASSHPLDDPDPRFAEFIQYPAAMAFEPWQDMRVDVSNDVEPELFDSYNVETYYSSWQVLLAAE
jgi:hypothetical protein